MEQVLRVLNGAAVVPAFILLGVLILYLCRESVRRGLNPLGWFHLPPSMNLALAVFVLVAFLALRVATTWSWYLIGGKILTLQMTFAVAIVGIIVGLLCIIKAITAPDYGRWPWLATMMATIVLALVLI